MEGKSEMAPGFIHTGTDPSGALQLPEAGAGPLLQRDYWAVIKNSRVSPSELMRWVALRFPEFAPSELCVFEHKDPSHLGAPLAPGDELTVKIMGAGTFSVRVIHQDAQSLTIGTLHGHPEAGRITFGAYRNAHGDVIFHIRSRARSGSTFHYLGFVTAGDAMQTNTWTEFVLRAALTAGDGVLGVIHADTMELVDEPSGGDVAHGPTFLAQGD